MVDNNILMWSVMTILILFIVCGALNDSEPFNMANVGSTSTLRGRMQERNRDLAMKCARMFTGYPNFISRCTAEDGSHLRYAVEINNTFAIWRQNYIDNIKWRPEVYLALILGRPEDVICEVVYPPKQRRGCGQMSEGMRREAWYQYWIVRRNKSFNWQLTNAHTRMR